uniref:Uncharacterized protein n=1 Tax=Chrysotila carterae TaxID=13221 RepID=A0A7S4EXJ6_CHRCT
MHAFKGNICNARAKIVRNAGGHAGAKSNHSQRRYAPTSQFRAKTGVGTCLGGSGLFPEVGCEESSEAKLCAVGTSTYSPVAFPLCHFPLLTVHRHVRSIWQKRYHGTTTVRLCTLHSSYSPSGRERFHLPSA